MKTYEGHQGASVMKHPVITEIANRIGKSPAQVCIRWAIQRYIHMYTPRYAIVCICMKLQSVSQQRLLHIYIPNSMYVFICMYKKANFMHVHVYKFYVVAYLLSQIYARGSHMKISLHKYTNMNT